MGEYIGTATGVIQGDTWSLDDSSYYSLIISVCLK